MDMNQTIEIQSVEKEIFEDYKKINTEIRNLSNNIAQENFRESFMDEMKEKLNFMRVVQNEMMKFFQDEYTREEMGELRK